MVKTTRFFVTIHYALKAGKHFDLRVKNLSQDTGKWDSFAIPSGIPETRGKKVLMIRTPIHSEEDALFVGKIPEGLYGAGTLKKYDEGECIIEKNTDKHIVLNFYGKKIKGIYHIIFMGNKKTGGKTQKQYILFKSGIKVE
jgi:bifunctional non-homologous end joining protein LigD